MLDKNYLFSKTDSNLISEAIQRLSHMSRLNVQTIGLLFDFLCLRIFLAISIA